MRETSRSGMASGEALINVQMTTSILLLGEAGIVSDTI